MKIDMAKIRGAFLRETIKSERGFILILALVSMVAMTVIGISLIMNMTTDLQLARNEREAKLAFQLADAGINEAIARFRLNLTPSPPYIGEPSPPAGTANVRTTTDWGGMSFSGSDGLGYGVDVSYLTEGAPYCDGNNGVAPNNSGNMPNVDANGNPTDGTEDCDPAEVVMFGRDFNLDATLTSIRFGKNPVYRVVSTGTSGTTRRVIEAYIGSSSLNTDTEGGLNTNGCVTGIVAATNIENITQAAGCVDDPDQPVYNPDKTASDNLDTFLGGDSLDDIAAMANETHRCLGATCNAAGDDIPSSGQIDGVVTDWGTFGGTHSTIIFIDNEGGNGVRIGGNLTGRGILVVTGNITIAGDLNYQGLVYVKGAITVGGSMTVTGGVMSGGLANVNGNVTIDYNLAILMDVGRQNSGRSMIVWRRL